MSAKITSPKVTIDLYPTERIKFWAPVSIPTAEGKMLDIKLRYLHRTREEQAELAEARMDRARARFEQAEADAKKAKAPEPAESETQPLFPQTPKFVEQVQEEMAESVEGILEIADDWDVDGFEFNEKNLRQLCNLHQASASTIATTYRDALAKGRLGN